MDQEKRPFCCFRKYSPVVKWTLYSPNRCEDVIFISKNPSPCKSLAVYVFDMRTVVVSLHLENWYRCQLKRLVYFVRISYRVVIYLIILGFSIDLQDCKIFELASGAYSWIYRYYEIEQNLNHQAA